MGTSLHVATLTPRAASQNAPAIPRVGDFVTVKVNS